MTELPRAVGFEEARSRIDDLLRANVDKFGPCHFDEDGDEATRVEPVILGDWVVLTHWIAQDGEHYYVRISAPGIAPHASAGLLALFDGDD